MYQLLNLRMMWTAGMMKFSTALIRTRTFYPSSRHADTGTVTKVIVKLKGG